MTPPVLEKVDELRTQAKGGARISLTDLARGKAWRDELPECGIIEITDRSDTAGWLLSNEYVNDLLSLIDDLLADQERRQVNEMLAARSAYNDWRSGDELAARALADLDSHMVAMTEAARTAGDADVR